MEALGWIDSHRHAWSRCRPLVCALSYAPLRAVPRGRAVGQSRDHGCWPPGAQCRWRCPDAPEPCATVRDAVAVSEPEILWGVKEIGQSEGLFVCPEGGAALAGLRR